MQVYVVKGIRTVNGKSETVWLAYHKEDGGEFQWTSNSWKDKAYRFDTPDQALQAANRCPGPWFNEPAKETIKILSADWTPPQPGKLVIQPD